MFRKLSIMLALLVAFGCTKHDDKASPQTTLSDYVSRSFGMKAPGDKTRLMELTTGQVKDTLEKMDDASFRQNFVEAKKEFVALKIRDERKLSDTKYSITYELTYQTTKPSPEGELKDKVTNKKHALFVNEGGKWLISEVHNIKTFIEHQNELHIDL